jgi:hypothetical protein
MSSGLSCSKSQGASSWGRRGLGWPAIKTVAEKLSDLPLGASAIDEDIHLTIQWVAGLPFTTAARLSTDLLISMNAAWSQIRTWPPGNHIRGSEVAITDPGPVSCSNSHASQGVAGRGSSIHSSCTPNIEDKADAFRRRAHF